MKRKYYNNTFIKLRDQDEFWMTMFLWEKAIRARVNKNVNKNYEYSKKMIVNNWQLKVCESEIHKYFPDLWYTIIRCMNDNNIVKNIEFWNNMSIAPKDEFWTLMSDLYYYSNGGSAKNVTAIEKQVNMIDKKFCEKFLIELHLDYKLRLYDHTRKLHNDLTYCFIRYNCMVNTLLKMPEKENVSK